MFLWPFGLYCIACFGSLFVSILFFQTANCTANFSGISSNASSLYDVKFVFRVELSFINAKNTAWFFFCVCLYFILRLLLVLASTASVTVYGVGKLSASFKIVHLLLFGWLAHFVTELFESSRLSCCNFTAHESNKCVAADVCFVHTCCRYHILHNRKFPLVPQ